MLELFRKGAAMGLMFLALSASLPGCESGAPTGGSNGSTQSSGETQVAVNDDPNSDLVAQAKVGDGSSFSIFGEKTNDGDVQQVNQLDVLLNNGESLTLELDDQERPIRVEGDESTTTFSYDDDTATVQAEVSDNAGTTVLEGDVQIQPSAKVFGRTFRATPQSLCERLDGAKAVLQNLFPCAENQDESECRGRGARVLDVLEQFCAAQAEVVTNVDTNLGSERKEIPLGVKGFFTTRPRDGGATVVLVATVFGGVKPIDTVVWNLDSGPDAAVENLPGGVAVGDIGQDGTHTFKVTAKDAAGTTATTDVTVGNTELPMIEVVADPPNAAPGDTVLFSIKSSVELPEDIVANTKWRFGDGTEAVGAEVTHEFNEDGAFVVLALLRGDGRRETASTVVRVGDDLECWEGCQTRAEQVFFECDFNAPPGANCAARSNAVLAECLAERCGEELDCEFHCARFGARVRRHCVASGGPRRLCAAAGRAARAYCTAEQCDEEPDCEFYCNEDSDLFFDECTDGDEANVDCDAESEKLVEACITDECGDEFACEDDCADQADRLFDACRAGGASPDECAARSRRFFEDCVFEECDVEFDCELVCEDQRDQIIEECEADGIDPQVCRQEARDFVDFCLFEHCDVLTDDLPIDGSPGPIDPNDVGDSGDPGEECRALCRTDADEARRICRDDGGTATECGLLGDLIHQDCVSLFCDDEGGDPLGDGPFGDDPFGGDPFGDDPFGGDPSGGDPFPPFPPGDDPFGDDPPPPPPGGP